MDRIFANCVDQIALAGSDGLPFYDAVHTVMGPEPDLAIVAWVVFELRKRTPVLFTSPDFDAPPETLHVSACEALCNRALGYNVLEHSNIPLQARKILEVVGRGGPNGVLQSDLSRICNLTSVMVHHYLVSLLNRELVAKKKVVLTRKLQNQSLLTSTRKEAVTNKDCSDDENIAEEHLCNVKSPCNNPSVTVTYTAVIVLSRFEAFIANTDLTKTFRSIQNDIPIPAPGAPAAFANQFSSGDASADCDANLSNQSASVSIIDLTGDERMQTVLDALRASNVRAERDLKMMCMPDSERPVEMTLEVFRRKRHRTYRTLRGRLVRLGLARLVKRECRSTTGKDLGKQPCLVLTQLGQADNAIQDAFRKQNQLGGYGQTTPLSDTAMSQLKVKASTTLPRELHPLLANLDGPGMVAEVDIAQQVYDLMVKAGRQGISVPELDAYLDGGTGLTGMPQKRIRNIIKAISRKEEVVESQLFEGKTMFVRFSLARFVDLNDPSFRKSVPNRDRNEDESSVPFRRRKTGITSLGEQRQDIILDLLAETKVVVLETLGREVAKKERSGLVRVDQKVMRRVINDLVIKEKIKIITATKPSIKENKRWQTIRLVALPEMQENSIEVRRLITTVVDRALYGSAEDSSVKKEIELCDVAFDSESPENQTGSACKQSRDENDPQFISNAIDDPDLNCESDGDGEPVIVETVLDRPKKSPGSVSGKKKTPSQKKSRASFTGATNDIQVPDATRGTISRRRKRFCRSVTLAKDTETDHNFNDTVNICKEGSGLNDDLTLQDANHPHSMSGVELEGFNVGELPESTPRNAEYEQQITAGSITDDVADDVVNSLGDGDVIEVAVQSSACNNTRAKNKAICVQNNGRDSRKARIARLRAIDYGWIKGSMARARLFHKLLFKIAVDREKQKLEKDCVSPPDILDMSNEAEVSHMTIQEGRALPTIGELNIYSCFSEMTVSEYAATVGMSFEHGDLLESIKNDRVEDVINIIRPEITSQYACRRIKSLVQLLTKLELILPKGTFLWTLCGSGMIRDYGRGIPPGVIPHAVPFKNRKGVDIFWKELRQFSAFKMPRGRKVVQWGSNAFQEEFSRPIRDIYHPVAWDTGLYQDFSLYDQVLFEGVLQRLCGVDISVETLNLAKVPLISEPLRAFTVEELVDELDRVGKSNPHVGKRQRYAAMSESLLRYARLRSKSNIPKRLVQESEGFGLQWGEIASPKDVPIQAKSSVLRVKKKGSEIEGVEVLKPPSALSNLERKKPNKTHTKKKFKIDEAALITLKAHTIVSYLRAIIQYGSVSYCCEDVDFSDWRKVAAAVHSKKHANDPESAKEEERKTFRAVTGLCHCVFLRSAFDILSFRVVLKIRDQTMRETFSETRLLPREKVSELADEVLAGWENLNNILLAIVAEVQEEVEREWRVIITHDEDISAGSMPRLANLELLVGENRRGLSNARSLSQVVHIMSSRFQRVANLRVRRSVRLGILLESDHIEDGEEFENPRGRGKKRRLGNRGRNRRAKKTKIHDCRIDDPSEQSKEQNVHSTGGVENNKNADNYVDKKALMHGGSVMKLKRDFAQPNVHPTSARIELVEIVVITVLRQNRFEQWSVETTDLLRKIDEDILCLARDRLLLRGSVVVAEDYDDRERRLVVSKPSKVQETVVHLSEENIVEREKTWRSNMADMMRISENTDFNMDETELFKEITKPNPSASSSAVNFLTRIAILTNDPCIELSPLFVKGEGGGEKCIIKTKWTQNNTSRDEQTDQPASKCDDKEVSEHSGLVDWITSSILSCEQHGLMLDFLLSKIKEKGKWQSAEEVARCLQEVKRRGKVQRFAIEVEKKEWDLSDGALFLGNEYCKCLKRSQGWVHAWSRVDGSVDIPLVREIATLMLETVMRKPGMEITKLINLLAEKYLWIPRRAIGDLVFGLIRKGFMLMDAIVMDNGKWSSFKDNVPLGDTDSFVAMFWRRSHKACVKVATHRVQGGREWAGSEIDVCELIEPPNMYSDTELRDN